MKLFYAFMVVLALSLVSTVSASDFRYVDREVRKTDSLGERFWQAVFPGFKESDDTYNAAALAPQDKPYDSAFESSNSFQSTFTDGRSRRYVNNEDSSFAVDPTTPRGNVFNFKF